MHACTWKEEVHVDSADFGQDGIMHRVISSQTGYNHFQYVTNIPPGLHVPIGAARALPLCMCVPLTIQSLMHQTIFFPIAHVHGKETED
jgi:hypothetical protein